MKNEKLLDLQTNKNHNEKVFLNIINNAKQGIGFD